MNGSNGILGRDAEVLAKLLDGASVRHRVTASNLANASNPSHRRREVRFDEALSRAISSGEDLASVKPEVVTTGERVDLETEMGRLTQNSLTYKVWAEVLARKIGTLRVAITGR
jgi:flagellar basal-body rod protein FlgB